jgi:hypothetical protein
MKLEARSRIFRVFGPEPIAAPETSIIVHSNLTELSLRYHHDSSPDTGTDFPYNFIAAGGIPTRQLQVSTV